MSIELEVEDCGPVRRLRPSGPDQASAQIWKMPDSLDQQLSAADADESVRCTAIGSHGKHFSAGHDIQETQEKRNHLTMRERHDDKQERHFGYGLRIGLVNEVVPRDRLSDATMAMAARIAAAPPFAARPWPRDRHQSGKRPRLA
jgi:enoyl-CoA hydratase/carnithine racemase